MANVLTDLAADIYKAADVVGREQVGFAPSSLINADGSERAAVNDVVRSHFTRQATAVNATAAMTVPEGTDQTVDNKTMSITKDRAVQIPWTGEDIKHVDNGSGWSSIYGDQIEQAMRTLANEVEADLAVEAYKNASRSIGVEGTTPFASDFKDVANVRKILVDNGMPMDGRVTLCVDTAAGTNLRNLATLHQVNTSGNDRLLRQGELLNLQGVMLKESAQIQTHTATAGSGYLINGTPAIGATSIPVDTGTGALTAGDNFVIAGDTNNYVVVTDYAGGAGNIEIGSPGLLIAPADNAAITLNATDYAANVCFHQTALEVAMRAPALPAGGDAAVDRMTIQDPHSGLVFEIAAYVGYRKAMFSVGAVWGVKAWKPDHIALLVG